MRGRWGEVYPHFNFRINPSVHIKCPFCGKKNFRITNFRGNGEYYCTCSNGTGITFLLKLLKPIEYGDLARKLESILGIENSFVSKHIDNSDYMKWMAKWKNGARLQGTNGEFYLREHRKIEVLPIGGVKLVKKEPYFDEDGNLISYHNALFAIASSHDRDPVMGHLTYLNDEHNKVNPPFIARKTKVIKPDYGKPIAVKLFDFGENLMVGEGIETCLAAYQIFSKELPVWACLNSVFLSKFVPPNGVKHLSIMADNDVNSASGHVAAFSCAKKSLLDKSQETLESVTVMIPNYPGDANDVLKNHSPSFQTFQKTIFKRK